MAAGRTVSLIFKTSEGKSLPAVSFNVNDGAKGDNASLVIENLRPAVKGGETSFPVGNVNVISVHINGVNQPQGYAYTVETNTVYLAEAVKSTDVLSIEFVR
ncbi:hypothetical protein [Pectobacterium carotovorum]|uniref:hypothetical protein n=1 Tax=Pectobacterium carotovorum TaxID=554 RepID=UPI00057EFC0C|nr:hypothetical protein [Pectobacterium carotovorum]KHT36628.1 hypothetical protein RC99_03625 [Pectobacterium carotovorum subsp. carotovorum]